MISNIKENAEKTNKNVNMKHMFGCISVSSSNKINETILNTILTINIK